MTKFRQHRGGFDDSMATVVDARTLADVERILSELYPGASTKGRVKIKPYAGIDLRNGWDTHVVLLDHSVVGFTDGQA